MSLNDEILKKRANPLLQSIQELSEERVKAEKDFLKTITTIATGFLGLFIGLNDISNESYNIKLFFFITILGLSLGITFSICSLYSELYFIDKRQIINRNRLKILLKNPYASHDFRYIPQSKLVRFSLFLTYFSYLGAIFSLILYSYFLIFN